MVLKMSRMYNGSAVGELAEKLSAGGKNFETIYEATKKSLSETDAVDILDHLEENKPLADLASFVINFGVELYDNSK